MREWGKIIVGLVEDAVAESCSYKHSEEAVLEQGLEEFFFYSLLLIQALHYEIGAEQS